MDPARPQRLLLQRRGFPELAFRSVHPLAAQQFPVFVPGRIPQTSPNEMKNFMNSDQRQCLRMVQNFGFEHDPALADEARGIHRGPQPGPAREQFAPMRR